MILFLFEVSFISFFLRNEVVNFFWSFWSFEFFFLFRPGILSPWRGLSRDASLSLPQSVLAFSEREKPELQIGCFLFSAKEEGGSKGKERKLEIEKKMTLFRSVLLLPLSSPPPSTLSLPPKLAMPRALCN